MDRALKQRLLGAVILAALLVILIPEWLDGSGHRARYPKKVEIPPSPVFKPLAEFNSGRSGKSSADSSSQTTKQKTAKTNTLKAKTATKTNIHAWTLQVGSFKDETNALVLRDRLRANGYPAYVEKLKTVTKIPYRVRIGPELDREQVNKLKQTILKKEKIEGLVVKHP